MRTKKKTAFGVAVAGAAAVAITGGTFATFSDTDGQNVSADAGSVVLEVNGSEPQNISFDNIKPGDSKTFSWEIENAGTLDGNFSLDSFSITDSENGVLNPESDAGDGGNNTGELSQYIELDITYEGNNLWSGKLEGLKGVSAPGGSVPLAAGDSKTLEIDAEFVDGGTGAENDAQSDSVSVDWEATLEQS